MRTDPKFCREQAERCRKIAAHTVDTEMKEHLVGVAGNYDKLAEEGERKR